MEDLWRQVFSVGTEWEAMDEIYGSNWDFSNLENAFEEGGELLGQNVYLFGCTETQGIADASLVPVVVAVVSRFAPSDKIAIVSVQRANEQIWPMKRLKMDWYPYIPLGRRDGQHFATRNETLAFLPPSTGNTTSLVASFGKLNLDTLDLVALSGGHTIRIGHCGSFSNRLYPTRDPVMENSFARKLYRTCPTSDSNNTVVLDLKSPSRFDNKYCVNLMNRQGLFTSDQDLYTDRRTRGIVTSFALDQELFFESFAYSMVKMGQLSVLTGNQGESRAKCSARNLD